MTYHLFYKDNDVQDESVPRNDFSSKIFEGNLFRFFFLIFKGLFKANLLHQKALNTEVKKLGILLEHDYSKATLRADQLKGKDRSLYNILSSASSLKIQLMPIDVEVQGRRTERERDTGK